MIRLMMMAVVMLVIVTMMVVMMMFVIMMVVMTMAVMIVYHAADVDGCDALLNSSLFLKCWCTFGGAKV